MKHTKFLGFPVVILLLALVPALVASATWYVDGINGSDSNNCTSPTTACKTIGHAISRAASGDSISIAAATYKENLTISKSLNITGSGASTTIVDGGGVNTVVKVSSTTAHVGLSNVTVRNGLHFVGGGISNSGTLTVNNSTISGNTARGGGSAGLGGGIGNLGTLTVNNSTVNRNTVSGPFGAGFGGGIGNGGTLTVNNSTITGNTASGWGGGIGNEGGNVTISNSTISGNKEIYNHGGVANYSGAVTLQNSIVGNNSGGDCYERTTITSKGYNLSSDGTCNFHGSGDMNNTNPMLGSLQNNGGPTQTQALLSGSPAIDAGNPNGCTDGSGHLLKTDQRGKPRPDSEDAGGCDMGAYEHQGD